MRQFDIAINKATHKNIKGEEYCKTGIVQAVDNTTAIITKKADAQRQGRLPQCVRLFNPNHRRTNLREARTLY